MIKVASKLAVGTFDHIFDKIDNFYKLLPYIRKKLSGSWSIEIVHPSIEDTRRLLDSRDIPDYLDITVILDEDVIEKLKTERASLNVEDNKTFKEVYEQLIGNLPLPIEPKAAKYIYYNSNKNTATLKSNVETVIEKCKDDGTITYKKVKAVLISRKFYFANNVIQAFITNKFDKWNILSSFILDLGVEKAFYTLRKYVYSLVEQKSRYMVNEPYDDRLVTEIDTYTLAFLHLLFQTADNPNQLYLLMDLLDRRYQQKGGLEYVILQREQIDSNEC